MLQLYISPTTEQAVLDTCDRKLLICLPNSLEIIPDGQVSKISGSCLAICDRLFSPLIISSLECPKILNIIEIIDIS